jgi:hypothetical protein
MDDRPTDPVVSRPFGQVADGPARPYEGLGLGLTIASRLIGLHGGAPDDRQCAAGGDRDLSRFPGAVANRPGQGSGQLQNRGKASWLQWSGRFFDGSRSSPGVNM